MRDTSGSGVDPEFALEGESHWGGGDMDEGGVLAFGQGVRGGIGVRRARTVQLA
ncbi:hypothetical protein [Nocardia pseudobrasiliensis]|uniref:hypothetical protein n=1 Tax=Nocardia pseudobrasiliensis TaxID=45979 RepID=UPI001FE798B9|nr:hypothetical protein [Nocardia pseudobrasiliensis]